MIDVVMPCVILSSVIMLGVIMSCFITPNVVFSGIFKLSVEYRFAKCHYAECHCFKCHSTKYRMLTVELNHFDLENQVVTEPNQNIIKGDSY